MNEPISFQKYKNELYEDDELHKKWLEYLKELDLCIQNGNEGLENLYEHKKT